jgi:hypothetical protein
MNSFPSLSEAMAMPKGTRTRRCYIPTPPKVAPAATTWAARIKTANNIVLPPKKQVWWWDWTRYCNEYDHVMLIGPMPKALHVEREMCEAEARWRRVRPSAALSQYTGDDYMELREEELLRRGGQALVDEWRGSFLCITIPCDD